MTTAAKIANIINSSTKTTGMTASVVNGVCIAHVPFQSSISGKGYEQVAINTEQFAQILVRDMQ